MSILVLDKCGQPLRWATVEEGIIHKAKDQIVWDIGEYEFTLHGGIARSTGDRSQLSVKSIIAIDGTIKTNPKSLAVVTRRKLFGRDRNVCAYCGKHYEIGDLSMDHVTPSSRGGADSWTNLVTACLWCNQRKDDRTPEEAKMPLLYVPYTPNKYESMILSGRRILADQMEFLLGGVPQHSRLLQT